MKLLRYGHSEGHTDVSYNDLFKEYFATCGSEGDVRVWKGINDPDQKDVCVGDKAWAVNCKGSRLFVGTDSFLIQAFTFPDMEVDGIITRFTSPVTQIDVSKNGRMLAAGSCDMDIHVVDLDSLDRKTLTGHKGPVLSVSLHWKQNVLASSSCDGSVRIWDLESGSVTKQWTCVDKSNSFESAPSVCRIHFQPNGNLLAVPSSNGISTHDFDDDSSVSTTETLHADGDKYISVAKFSNCGEFLAGGSLKGNLFVWNVSSRKLVCKSIHNNDSQITSISWHHASSSLVYCNKSGQLGDLILPIETEVLNGNDLGDIPLGEPTFESDDEDDENIISLEKIKAQSSYAVDKPDDKEFDYLESAETQSISSAVVPKQIPLSVLQETFQPSSTPVHLQQRFMVWNNVGIVKQFSNDDFDEIDIEFHDTSIHHGFRLNNSAGYTMVALTEQVLILASPKKHGKPSKLYCVLLKAWDSQREWEYSLENEDIIAVAGGHNFVAIVTEAMMLRIFSIEGTQTDLHSIPGPLISLVGHQDSLTYYYHSGQGCNKDSFISFGLLKVHPKNKIANLIFYQHVPLSSKSEICWIGFSDEGSPATLDSEGVVRLLYKCIWRPICCLESRNKGKFDHYFVIGLSEKTHTIRSILCKGSYYPPVLPKPIVSEIKWQLPLFDLGTEKGDLEEDLLRNVITVNNLDDISEPFDDSLEDKKAMEKTISVTIMKLFALACRSGLDGKALSLCESMSSVDVVKLASKYAAKLGRLQLANKVSAVVAERMAKLNECTAKPETRPSGQESFERAQGLNRNSASQDLFEDSDSAPANTACKENLILKMRKKKAENVPKPTLIKRPTSNPFKIPSNNTSDSESADKKNFVDWFNENKPLLKEDNPLMGPSELAVFGMKKFKQHEITSPKESKSSEEKTNPSPTSMPTQEEIIEASPPEPVETKKRKNADFSMSSNKRIPTSSAASKLKSFSFQKKT